MTQNSAEFAKKRITTKTTSTTTTTATPATMTSSANHKQNCDILLNNFQIKKKSYRVLLNYDHIVWERLNCKSNKKAEQMKQNVDTKKETEQQHEHEQLSNRGTATNPTYGIHSNVLHLDEIISIHKGDTKHASLRPTPMSEMAAATNQIPTAQYLSIHYAERIIKSATDCNRWQVRHLTLYNSDPYIVRQWHRLLNEMLQNSSRLSVKRLLVFINPYGGRKEGLQTYERHCKPLFQLAGIDASCIISQRANQIRDILMSHDLSVFDAVCCVGGDGTVAEVINGLIYRTMRELALDMRRPAYVPKPMLPVGIIPAGSTDTVAYSLHGTSDVRTAAIHLILGQRRGLDICSVRNRDSLLRFCASVLSYGYLGDVAAKSEQYRWMGTKRYEYTGVKAFLGNRGYEAELRILLPDDVAVAADIQPAHSNSSVERDSVGETSVCYANCQRCSIAASMQDLTHAPESLFGAEETDDDNENVDVQTLPCEGNVVSKPVDQLDKNINVIETTEAAAQQFKTQQSSSDAAILRQKYNSGNEAPTVGATNATLSFSSNSTFSVNSQANWKTVKGKFFMITGANITCACERSPNGISRYGHLGDGCLDLILVRKTSLLNNVRFLLNTVGRNGDIRSLPFVEVYRTRKFTFRIEHSSVEEDNSIRGSCQPITETFRGDSNATINDCVSSWNCDGEVVEDLEVTMSSHCQLVDVFMRGPQSYIQTQNVRQNASVFCCCRE